MTKIVNVSVFPFILPSLDQSMREEGQAPASPNEANESDLVYDPSNVNNAHTITARR